MKNNRVLIFLTLVFIALFSYWTFEQVKYYRDRDNNGAFENLPDTSSIFTDEPEIEDIEDIGTTPTPTPSSTPSRDEVKPNVSGTQNTQPSVFGQWVANDYKQGDISKGSYTVKSGDTLWELAEAVYGDGTQWVNILNANSGSIGYLANGQHALIVTGQVIQIP